MDPDKIFAGAITRFGRTGSGPTIAPTESFKGRKPEPKREDEGGAISQTLGWIGNVGRQTGSLVKDAGVGLAKYIGNTALESARAVYDFSDAVGKTVTGSYGRELDYINMQNEQASKMFEDATRAYKAGKMTQEAWKRAQQDYVDTLSQSNQRIASVQKGVDKSDFVEDAALTASTIFAFGKFKGLGQVDDALNSRVVIKALENSKGGAIANSALKLDDLVAKVPSVRDLLVRNGATAAGRGVTNESTRRVASALLIKQPFVYHAGIDDAKAIYEDMATGKYGAAMARLGFTATLAFDGGIFGRILKGAKDAGGAGKKALFGVGSTIDSLGRNLSEANPTAIHELLESIDNGVYKAGQKLTKEEKEAWNFLKGMSRAEVEETLTLFNESMLRATGDDVFEVMARLSADNNMRLGRNLSDVSAAEWVAQNLKYQRAAQRLADVAEAGKIKGVEPEDFRKLALGVFDSGSKKHFLKAMQGADSQIDQLKILDEWSNSGKAPAWMQNDDMRAAIAKRIKAADGDYKKLKASIERMTTAFALKNIPKGLAKEMADAGYVVIKPFKRESPFVRPEETRRLTTAFENSFNWDPAFAPNKALRTIGGGLRKSGVSPEDTTRVAYQKLASNMDENLGQLDFLKMSGKEVTDTLRNYAETKRAVTDLRMLRKGEIMEALNIKKADVKKVQTAITQAHLQVPLELRGLGDRMIDRLYQLPYYKYQARVQSGARYAYNPFFKFQENVETEMLSQLQAGGKAPSFFGLDDMAERIFPNYYNKLDDATAELQRAGIFSETFSGAGADDVVIGRITANMTKSQKRSLAGLALKIADKQGTDLATLLARDPETIEDALRVIVQYPRKGAVNSSLVKLLNVAIFPTRYNLKLANITAKELAKLPPTLQLTFLNSMFDFSSWLNGPEGTAWQAEHQEALRLYQWVTPFGSLQALAKAADVATGEGSIGDLGMLGGLPFGWIGQVLDGQGVIELDTPYVDYSEGEVYSKELPANAKGRVYLATIDLLNQLFTYPGRTVGLPGKGAVLRDIVGGATGIDRGTDTEFVDQEEFLTPRQKEKIEEIRKRLEDSGQDPNSTIPYYYIPINEQLERDLKGEAVVPVTRRRRSGGGGQTVADPSPLGPRP